MSTESPTPTTYPDAVVAGARARYEASHRGFGVLWIHLTSNEQREECRAFAAGLEAMWQPIETAPKDGTNIIANVPGFGMGKMVLFWMDSRWRESAQMLGLKVEPTHWMPLPQPPRTTGDPS